LPILRLSQGLGGTPCKREKMGRAAGKAKTPAKATIRFHLISPVRQYRHRLRRLFSIRVMKPQPEHPVPGKTRARVVRAVGYSTPALNVRGATVPGL